MRKHRSDHTAAGFLFRASIGSLSKFIRRSISFRSLLINLVAAVKWPFVQMGLARDPWADFYRTYQEVEKGLPCTYFVIPFAGKSGNTRNGPAPKHRASGYGAIDLRSAIHEISEMGNELGLHGIDAWIDSQSAQKELAEIQRLTGATRAGVRMHWLYFDEQSPRQLELAGVNYDSTVGYRETIGFRAGALQPYVHLSTEALLELPLHAMDTALFYPAYLGLKASEACKLLESIVDNAARFGGCLTINWHDRSLSPERQWDVAYRDLLLLLKRSGAWFTTASEATAWFHARRAFTFVEQKDDYSNTSYSNLSSGPGLPPMTIRKHSPASEAVVPSYLT
jgi:peptidoglycan/xylan/chitin deacetylase (PgdA/CDA1 family)